MKKSIKKIGSSSLFEYDTEQKKLTVRGVSEFPDEILRYADELEILDMSDNFLTEIPNTFAKLKKVRVAFFSGNKFQEVPSILAQSSSLEMVGLKSCGIEKMGDNTLPPQLRGLILTDNKLENLPSSTGEYRALQKLMLTGNSLTTLPESMRSLSQLELIRVSDNDLSEVPPWLTELPGLAWYADSENNFNSVPSLDLLSVRKFDWNNITFNEKVGESAKNTVYRANLGGNESVAIKLFGKGVTTDGSPSSDIIASLIAGDHPNVTGGLGRIINTPNGEQGLVMALVPKEYKSLGFPPNFQDLTRDNYPEKFRLPPRIIIRIAQDVCRGLLHLHSRGVMHGDIYAHNILFDAEGASKIVDFGASSLYDPSNPNQKWREKIDVVGYGYVIDELLSHTYYDANFSRFLHALGQVRDMCIQKDFLRRPTFTEIGKYLSLENS